ncbi:dTDP-4-dehydrorhamnose reductase [Ammonifex degensii KC4]|uniref:dTDP-4-dehydrorhamnose reductase n=1 Tax=Ammonifex degensii (strain DSM 10501 / KC4) TaxID=429009 RepID=C9R8P6_AMMDK|nr:dTDP-4-dehydrorhamnose reductase [Ammonifex degensii]ACX52675.1 dTDP-4-dehydrorhamnose reductase [Ammonifex degensii KC4]
MRVLVTGAAGRLGRAMVKELEERGFDVIGLARQQLDITSRKAVAEVLREYRPRVVVNCAAYTDVDGAEEDPRRAFLVNGLAVKYLASLCAASEAKLVHISTDYVFDGEKGEPYHVYDPPRPINRYGESKYWGEAAIREEGGDYLIVRISWLFGTGRNFVSMILRLAETEGEIKVVEDQYGSPTYTPDAARAITDLILAGARGTFHVTNAGTASWYELACSAVRLAGIKANVIPCRSEDFPRPARRPRYTVLDPFPLKEYLGYSLPSWEDALERYLARR